MKNTCQAIKRRWKMKMDSAGHGGASARDDALQDKAFETAWMLAHLGITRYLTSCQLFRRQGFLR